MQMQQINKSDAEKVLIVFKNVDAATVSTGLGVRLIVTGASCDGVQSVKQPVTTYGSHFMGISIKDVPVNGYGLAVVWGLADSVALSAVGTSITITAGDQLWPSGVGGYFFSNTNGALVVNAALSTLTAATFLPAVRPFVTCVDTTNISTTAYTRGIIRAL